MHTFSFIFKASELEGKKRHFCGTLGMGDAIFMTSLFLSALSGVIEDKLSLAVKQN